MARDYKNDSSFSVLFTPVSSATNNSASPGLDIRGPYEGDCAVHVALGVQTAGDNAATMQVFLQHSATNSAAAATNISGASFTSDGNNLASGSGVIQVDPRATLRYLFARKVITGGNSPAWPVSVVFVGQKQVQ